MKDLDHRERKFLEHYLDTGNAAEAATLAGYDLSSRRVAASKGSELLARPHIQAELEAHVAQLRERYSSSRENIVEEIAKIAYSDIRDLFVIEPVLDDEGNKKGEKIRAELSRLDAITARAISEIQVKPDGTLRIKMHSKLGALEMLAKIQKLLVDRVEIDDVTNPIQRIREARARAREHLDYDPFADDPIKTIEGTASHAPERGEGDA